mgnify:FL=1
MMLWSLVVSLIYHEDDIFAFFSSIILAILAGITLRFIGHHASNNLGRRDAYLVVTLVWIIFSAVGTLPFLIGGYGNLTFTDAFFEMMSGFTTTGATVIDNVESLPHGILFWRSSTHWIGGIGIAIFTLAMLPSLVGGSMKVFAAESTGPIKTKLHPRLSSSARSLWIIYLILTLSCIFCYYLAGMNFFDSINYAMASTATGGFSTHNNSVLYFHSPTIEYTVTFFCFLSSINLSLYLPFAKLHFKQLFCSSEFRFFSSVVAIATITIAVLLISKNNYGIEHAFRSSVFEVVTIISTTGFFNDDAAKWPHITWVILALCMFIGGMAGSTAGGFKCIRANMVLKITRNEFKKIIHPKAVLPLKIDGVNIPMDNRVTLLAFLSIYVILIIVSSFSIIVSGVNSTDAITIALSSMGNVGPALGSEIGPTISWMSLPWFDKWICSFLMLVGRLEIFTVLVIFTPAFWKKV